MIFGDLNGDGMINNSDVADLRMMNARLKNSTFNNPYTFAADIFADGDINNTDVSLLRMMNGRLATIDQATRERLS